jgi:hypothetical protein
MTVTRTGLVDVVLNNGSVDHGQGCDPETASDTVDWREADVALAQERHEELIDKRQEDDDGNRVEVLHQIVGDTVSSHLAGLGNEVVGEVAVHDPVDRVETENLASNKSTLDLVDKVIVPSKDCSVSEPSLVRRFRTIHFAVLDHHEDDPESIGDDGALRRSDNVDLATEDEDKSTDEEDAQTQQVGRPEIGIELHVGSRDEGEGTGVDTKVEHHVDPLNGNSRVNDDALASLLVGTNDHLSPLVLIGDEGSDVGLDTARSETNDNDGENESRHTGAMIESGREGCACKDEETDDVDTTEDDDSVVLSEILISNDGTWSKLVRGPISSQAVKSYLELG